MAHWQELSLVSSAFPVFEIVLLSPQHDLLESPAPALISHCREFPDGNALYKRKGEACVLQSSQQGVQRGYIGYMGKNFSIRAKDSFYGIQDGGRQRSAETIPFS